MSARQRLSRAALVALLACAGCAGGTELAADESLPPAVDRALTVAVTPTFLARAAKRATANIQAAWPDGYPVVIPQTAWYDPATEVAVVYGPAEARALVQSVGVAPSGDDALHVEIALEDLTLDVAVHDPAGVHTCSLPIVLPGAQVGFDLLVARNKVGKAEPVAVLPAALSVDESPGAPETCDELGPAVTELVTTRATEAARAQLETSFVASLVPTIGDLLPLRMPAARRVTIPEASGVPGSISARLSATPSAGGASVLRVTEALVSLDADLSLSSARNGCVPDTTLPAATPVTPADLPAELPGGGDYDVAVRVSEAALAQAIAHAWRSGLLCDTVGTLQLPALTAASFAPWLPGIGPLADGDPVWLRFWPEALPTVELGDADGTTDGLAVTVTFPAIRVELYADVEETRLMLYGIEGAVALATHVELGPPTGGHAGLRLVVDGASAEKMTVTSPLHDGPVPAQDALAAQLWETAIGAALETMTWLELPTGEWTPTLLATAALGPGQGALFLGLGAPTPPTMFAPGPLPGLAALPEDAAPRSAFDLPPMGSGSAWRLDDRLWRSLTRGATVTTTPGTGIHRLEVRLSDGAVLAGYWVATGAADAPAAVSATPAGGCAASGGTVPFPWWQLVAVLAALRLLRRAPLRMMAPPLD